MSPSSSEVTPLDYTRFDFKNPETYRLRIAKGLTREVVEQISDFKAEPDWMREYRLRAYKHFVERPMPDWGPSLSDIDFDAYTYYANPMLEGETKKSWDDVPADIKNTFEKLGIPKAEREYFGGVGAQYDSGTVYHKIRADLSEKGVLFTDTDTAVKEHPEIVQKYFGKIVPYNDNKFAALNSAVWSGGSFVYVPPGVDVGIPLQAYFRINAKNVGQFERTLLIADKGSKLHYIEGCTAPVYSTNSLHAAVVEVVAEPNAKMRYTTVQNWSKNVYNLVTKRAVAYENALVEWVDGNMGSKVTMKYPSVYLKGRGARADILSVAFASQGQIIDSGAKAVHSAPDTSSKIVSKSIAIRGGQTSYRGLLHVARGHWRQGIGAVRRAPPGRGGTLRHLPLQRDPRGGRDHHPRGGGRQDRRGTDLLLDEPRAQRERRDPPDPDGVPRGVREGAADGLRDRAEPSHPARDGRRGRIDRPSTARPPRLYGGPGARSRGTVGTSVWDFTRSIAASIVA